jgi:RND family efflux transporter MFP subunit
MSKKVWIGLGIVAVAGLLIFAAVRNAGGGVGGKQVDAKYGRVVQGTVSSSILANGMVEEHEKYEVYLDVSVPVLDVLVEAGAEVEKGQQIAAFDLSDLQAEVQRLRNSLQTQELTLEKLRLMQDPRGTASLEASETVARNNLATAEAALAEAQKRLETQRALFATGTISQSELEQAERAVDDARAARANASANLASARASLSETRKSNASSQDSTDIDIRIQELAIEATQTSLEKAENALAEAETAMYAPHTGILSASTLRRGMYVGSPAQALYTVSDVSALKVRALVKEYDIRKVQTGQGVSLYGDAFDREEGVTGVVSRIGANAFKTQSGSAMDNVVEVMVAIGNTVPVLRPGLGATCVIFTERREAVPVLPLEAIAENKDGDKYVFVLKEPDLTMEQRFIKIGIFSDSVVEVTEGLAAGELVVLDPQPTFRDGIRAKGTEAGETVMRGGVVPVE